MGNRATVIFTDGNTNHSPAVYLHWNGGPESVYGFLEELDRRGVRADQDYECARFIQIVGEFFDSDGQDGLSLGVANGPAAQAISPETLRTVMTDHGDNGFYIVNRTVSPCAVRRFFEVEGGNLVEAPPEKVERERREAETDAYRPEFRKFYQALAASRTASGKKSH